MNPLKQSKLSAKDRVDYSEFYRALIRRRFELLRRDERDRAQIDQQQLTGGAPGDIVDNTDMSATTEYYLDLADRERQELIEIRDALERLHHGTYGYCQDCGGEISVERLRSIPYAKLCITCKSALEKKKHKNAS